MTEPWYQEGLRFRCTRCGKCCTGEPGYVWVDEEEIAAIAEYRGETIPHVTALYTRKGPGERSLREKINGDCVFYRSAGWLHDLSRSAKTMPHVAVLGEQREYARSLGSNAHYLPRLRARRPDSGGRDYPQAQGHPTVGPVLRGDRFITLAQFIAAQQARDLAARLLQNDPQAGTTTDHGDEHAEDALNISCLLRIQ